MRCACVDIGSNTTRLLVADRDDAGLRVVCEDRAFVGLGADLLDAEEISDAKAAEVIAVVDRQLATARDHEAAVVRGVATAAIRRAANGVELVREVRARTGLAVDVLSDREEARLAFVGAAGTLEGAVPESLGVLDVGGASSEVVVGRLPATIDWWASLPVGSGALVAHCLHSDPPTTLEVSRARADVAAATSRLGPAVPRPQRTLAVGGSATSLCRMCGERLTASALGEALQMLCDSPADAIAQRFEIDPRRARLLPGGLLILEALAGQIGGEISVGRGGIREGVLLEAQAR